MKSEAVEQARLRLQAMEEAYERYRGTQDLNEMKRQWTSFLLAFSTIYSKLEQGSKGPGPASAWYGRKKHERKSDPLLAYLHQARNNDEHGIDEVSSTVQWSVEAVAGEKFKFLGVKTRPDGQLEMVVDGEEPGTARTRGPHLMLKDVINYGVVYEWPKTHQGQKIIGSDVEVVAPLALQYAAKLIGDAEVLKP